MADPAARAEPLAAGERTKSVLEIDGTDVSGEQLEPLVSLLFEKTLEDR
jgi:hypothetical protein